jgi:hypothetical protein
VLLNAGTATFSNSSPTVGTHTATAVDGGDGNFGGSISEGLSQNVVYATATTVFSSVNPSKPGQPLTFRAIVSTIPSGGMPTGSVTFWYDGTENLGTRTLNGGVATLTTSIWKAGFITAVYARHAEYAGSVSSALNQGLVVTGAGTPLGNSGLGPAAGYMRNPVTGPTADTSSAAPRNIPPKPMAGPTTGLTRNPIMAPTTNASGSAPPDITPKPVADTTTGPSVIDAAGTTPDAATNDLSAWPADVDTGEASLAHAWVGATLSSGDTAFAPPDAGRAEIGMAVFGRGKPGDLKLAKQEPPFASRGSAAHPDARPSLSPRGSLGGINDEVRDQALAMMFAEAAISAVDVLDAGDLPPAAQEPQAEMSLLHALPVLDLRGMTATDWAWTAAAVALAAVAATRLGSWRCPLRPKDLAVIDELVFARLREEPGT